MRLLTLFFLIYLTQGLRIRRQVNENKPGTKKTCTRSTLTFFIQSLIDRIRAQARGQVFDSFFLKQNISYFFPDLQGASTDE